MSDIVLSASVRQNLLSLQASAHRLAAQSGLAEARKLADSPPPAERRAGDIGSLLESIGKGVQVLELANAGIASLASLVDSAKAVANQVLQSPLGYSAKASVEVTGAGAAGASGLHDGKLGGAVMTFRTAAGALAVTIGSTFSSGAGRATVRTLDQLNSVLASNGVTVTASLSPTYDTLIFVSTNDAASQAMTAVGKAPAGGVDITASGATAGNVTAAVADPISQAIRAGLLAQYNLIIQQITTIALDSSCNGVNLLNGDSLKLVFNQSGRSSLNIPGVTFDADGLGLASLTEGIDFLDDVSANNVIAKLDAASSLLRAEGAVLASSLAVVRIREDFTRNLIDVLQSGSANRRPADTREEAANSQALSARQSIAVSALALANQSQHTVLQLLR